MQGFEIRQAVLDAVIAHAEAEAPRECCGLLIGCDRLIDESVATSNIAAGETRFQVDPREHFDVRRRLRGTQRSILGAYHSHPRSPAVPSPTDIAEAFYSDLLHVIVSLAHPRDPVIRAFWIRAGNAEPAELVPVP